MKALQAATLAVGVLLVGFFTFSHARVSAQEGTSYSLADRMGSLKNLPQFPIQQQPDSISCGPTCCSMVLGYYGVSAGIGPLKTRAGTRIYSNGNAQVGLTLPGGMRNALASYGVPASVYRANFENIKAFIDADRPPILLVRSDVKTWHYVVVVAYYNNGSVFRIADPGNGQIYQLGADDLEIGWKFSGNYQGEIFEDRKCHICGGSGTAGWTECPTCGGTGRWKVGGFSRDCPVCSGRGRWSVKCYACGGDGKETDFFRKLVEQFASGNTLIVPDRARPSVPSPSTPSSNGGGGVGGKVASSIATYDVVTILNNTNGEITYSLRESATSPWRPYQIPAGGSRFHWVQAKSPAFQIYYDWDLTTNNQFQSYNLVTNRVYRSEPPTVNDGKKYRFSKKSEQALQFTMDP